MDIKRSRGKFRRRLFALSGTAVLAVGLPAVLVWSVYLQPGAPTVKVESLRIATVRRGELLKEIRGHGTLIAANEYTVAAPVGGRVEPIPTAPGERLTKGQVILTLSSEEAESDGLKAEAQLRAARAELTSLRAELDVELINQRAAIVEAEARRSQDELKARSEESLYKEGLSPKTQYEATCIVAKQSEALLTLDRETLNTLQQQIEARLASQAAKIEEAEALARHQRSRVESLTVRSPVDGVLQRLEVSTGQQVTPGALLASVVQIDRLRALLKIPEVQAKDVVVDQQAVMDTRNGKVRGRVFRVDPAVVEGTVAVEIEFTETLPPGARPDLSVTGTLEVDRLEDVLCVERPEYGQPESRVTLFRLTRDGRKAEQVAVELGTASAVEVEVRSGLQEGDRIVLNSVPVDENTGRFHIE